MTLRSILKLLGGLLLTVLVGAVGSGVWEKILSPLLQYTSSEVSTALSLISASYADSLYSSAAAYPGTGRRGDTASLLFIVLLLAWISWSLHDKTENRLVRAFSNAIKMYKGWAGAACALIVLMIVIIGNAKLVEVDRIQRENLTKLEVIRPNVGELTYLKLRAEFFGMKTERDFIAFKKSLKQVDLHPENATSKSGS
jgi:hypothetical protein